ncbi:MAG: hypothetical protein ABSF55_01775 [Candidatus Staskawiczbacteria bacterium]|jgi:hypothetical protein
MLVMPGIHEFPGHGWGWHEVADLVTAVNNLLEKQGVELRLKALELVQRFTALATDGRFICGLHWAYRGCNKWLADSNAPICHTYPGAVVPSGWGIAVIEAVKKGVTRVELVVSGDRCERRGFKENGSFVVLNA